MVKKSKRNGNESMDKRDVEGVTRKIQNEREKEIINETMRDKGERKEREKNSQKEGRKT